MSDEQPGKHSEASLAQLLESPRPIAHTRSPATDHLAVVEGVNLYRNGDPAKTSILVLGDSVADQWVNGLEEFCAANGLTFYSQTLSNSVPLIDTYVPAVEGTYNLPNKVRNESFGKILEAASAKHAIKHLILAGAWQGYINDAPQVPELLELHTGDRSATTVEQLREIVATQLEKTIAFFNERGVKVWVMLEPPEYDDNIPLKLAAFVKFNQSISLSYEPIEKPRQRREPAVKFISEIVAKFKRSEAEILDPFGLFCSDGVCFTVHDNRSLYFDRMHLSYYGSIFANKVFQPVADEIADEIKASQSPEKQSAKARGRLVR